MCYGQEGEKVIVRRIKNKQLDKHSLEHPDIKRNFFSWKKPYEFFLGVYVSLTIVIHESLSL